MSSDANRVEEMMIREQLPALLPQDTPVHFRYRSSTDTLTVLAGNQDRWSMSSANTGDCRVFLDGDGAPVRVEIPTATRRFAKTWLSQHERGRGIRWRLALGLP